AGGGSRPVFSGRGSPSTPFLVRYGTEIVVERVHDGTPSLNLLDDSTLERTVGDPSSNRTRLDTSGDGEPPYPSAVGRSIAWASLALERQSPRWLGAGRLVVPRSVSGMCTSRRVWWNIPSLAGSPIVESGLGALWLLLIWKLVWR